MYKAIVIRHKWHVNCEGWKTWEVESDTEHDLEHQILKIKDEYRDRFYSTGFKVIKILPKETHIIRKAAKLTWKERLFGRILFERCSTKHRCRHSDDWDDCPDCRH